jgi:hypothetical protein
MFNILLFEKTEIKNLFEIAEKVESKEVKKHRI